MLSLKPVTEVENFHKKKVNMQQKKLLYSYQYQASVKKTMHAVKRRFI